MIDDDRTELLERRLSEEVLSRVEKQIKKRYGFIALVCAAAAGFFGWTLKGEVGDIQNEITSAREQVEELTKSIEPIQLQLTNIQELAARFSTLEIEAVNLERRIDNAQSTQATFLRKQSEIVARNVGATLDIRSAASSKYFEQWKQFAKENNLAELEVYLLTKLAQNSAYISDSSSSKVYFDQAEEKAESLGGLVKLNVLLDRAASETESGSQSAALRTLNQRALSLIDAGDHFNQGRVWREMGNTYRVFGSLDLAISAFAKAAQYYESAEMHGLAALMYRRVGDIHVQTNQDSPAGLSEAINAYRESAELATYENDPWEEHYAHSNLAKLYLLSGSIDQHSRSVCAAAEAASRHPALRDRIDVVRRLTGDVSATYEEFCG